MIDVVRVGASLTVQDSGRPGWAHLGVPRSGALDLAALRLANRLVGNPEDSAGLEITIAGCALRLRVPATIAVTGALVPVGVDERYRGYGTALPIRAGSMVTIGPAITGVRSYLAVAGGIDVPAVLGSRSTDTLSGLGPAALRAGDVLPVGTHRGKPSIVDFAIPAPVHDDVVLRLRFGPRDGWFTGQARTTIVSSAYQVSVMSDRIGARLAGPALARAKPGELPSEGVVLGAVEVLTDGQPLVFLADHPVTGGYPVIGVVEPDDIALIAQARPGSSVRFREVRHGSQR